MSSQLPSPHLLAVPALALTLSPSAAPAGHGRHGGRGDNLIRIDLTLSLPTDDAINRENPGSLPWNIDRGEVRVRPSGRMDVRIQGLQIPRTTAPPTTRSPDRRAPLLRWRAAADSAPSR